MPFSTDYWGVVVDRAIKSCYADIITYVMRYTSALVSKWGG